MTKRIRNTEEFYAELKSIDSEVKKLKIWDDYEKGERGFIGSFVMGDLAKLVVNWVLRDEITKIEDLFIFLENSYSEFEYGANSYLYTDFYPEIISLENKEVRELLKNKLGSQSRKLYDQLISFGFYAEL